MGSSINVLPVWEQHNTSQSVPSKQSRKARLVSSDRLFFVLLQIPHIKCGCHYSLLKSSKLNKPHKVCAKVVLPCNTCFKSSIAKAILTAAAMVHPEPLTFRLHMPSPFSTHSYLASYDLPLQFLPVCDSSLIYWQFIGQVLSGKGERQRVLGCVFS